MSYTLTKADVTKIAGELSALDDPYWAECIDFAQMRVSNTSAWGGDAKAKQAATYMAAHLAKLALQAQTSRGVAGQAGPVLSIKVGPVEKTFESLQTMLGDPEAIAAGLGLTRYGVMFRGLQRLYGFTRYVVT